MLARGSGERLVKTPLTNQTINHLAVAAIVTLWLEICPVHFAL